MTTRKNFVKGILAGLVGITSANLVADINNASNHDYKYDILCEYLAEQYVNSVQSGTSNVMGPYKDKNGKIWYSAVPVGFIRAPNRKMDIKYCIEIPFNVRKVYADRYDIYTRKTLILQLKEYFLKEKIWEKYNLEGAK